MKTIAVIGAGVTGVTTAFVLSELGYKVTVFEKQRYPSIVTSYANGGQLSASNSEAWNSWSNTLYGIKSIFSKCLSSGFNMLIKQMIEPAELP